MTVTRHEDLDYAWGILDFEEDLAPVNLDVLHQNELISRSKGELSREDQKRLQKD